MKRSLLVMVILLPVLFISCNNSKKKFVEEAQLSEIKLEDQQTNTLKEKEEKIPLGKLPQAAADSTQSNQKPANNSSVAWDKKIIKTATVKLQVKDCNNFTAGVYSSVKQYGGYIAQEDQNNTAEKSEITMSVKVPADQFESMMNQLPAKAEKVVERKISAEDVTGEIIDVQSRLEAKKQMRLKYLDFLNHSKNMQEVLQVQSELNGLQETIESGTGRVNFLTHQSAMSTINLTIFSPVEGYDTANASPGFLNRIKYAFSSGLQWFSEILIALISIWPLILIIFVVIFGYKRMAASKSKSQKI